MKCQICHSTLPRKGVTDNRFFLFGKLSGILRPDETILYSLWYSYFGLLLNAKSYPSSCNSIFSGFIAISNRGSYNFFLKNQDQYLRQFSEGHLQLAYNKSQSNNFVPEFGLHQVSQILCLLLLFLSPKLLAFIYDNAMFFYPSSGKKIFIFSVFCHATWMDRCNFFCCSLSKGLIRVEKFYSIQTGYFSGSI